MSYSVCHQCKKMVSLYEKYCEECLEKYPAKQCLDYWKLSHEQQLAHDELEAKEFHEGE